MNRLWVLFSLLLPAALAGFCGPADAKFEGKGVALVIGNSRYAHSVNLPNPDKDALLVAGTLREAGFEVIQGNDLDKNGMTTVLDQFTEKAYDADVALIYYAGHGMEVDGKNFLIPVDAELTAPAHLKTRAIEAQQFLEALPPDPAVGIVILDACRDNPLAKTLVASLPASRSLKVELGLAPMQAADSENSDGGVLIAYSTWPGQIAMDGKGGNSPYSIALAKELTQPGVELQKALMNVRNDVKTETGNRQTPWISGSLGREVFLGGKVTEIAATAAPAEADSIQPVDAAQKPEGLGDKGPGWEVERRLWDEASKRNTAAYYEAYLAQFPNGSFASIAKLNIDQLKGQQVAAVEPQGSSVAETGSSGRTAVSVADEVKQAAGTPITESAIGLTKDRAADLQLRLAALGLDAGYADGNIGPRSRRAIAGWQGRHGIPQTTFLTQKQYDLLVVETDPMMPAVRAQQAQRPAPVQKTQKAQVRKTRTQKPAQTARRAVRQRSSQGGGVIVRRVQPSGNNDFATGVAVGAGAAALGALIANH